MSTMLLYPLYFKRYGVRLPGQLSAPRIFSSASLTVPRGTMIHYISDSKTEYGPASDDVFLKNVTRLIFIDHITELTSRQGNPRSAYVQPGPMIQAYRRKYQKIRPLTKIEIADREPQNLLISNYALLPHLYKYIRSFFTGYYTWSNIQATMWDTVNARMGDTKRNHFITLEMPDALPSLVALRMAEKRQTRETLKHFTTTGAFGLLDLWMWLGNNRETSLINRVTSKEFDRINFIINYKGHWLTINLGVLDGWRKNEDKDSKGLAPAMLQLRFLKMLTVLQESATVFDDGNKSAVDVLESDDAPDTQENDVQQQLEDLAEFGEDDVKDLEILTKELDLLDEDEEEFTEVYDEDGVLEEPAPTILPSAVEDTHQVSRSLEGAIRAKADALADKGLLSGAEYRRLQKLAEGYKTIKDPWGSGETLDQAIIIKPEDLVIKPDLDIPDSPSIIDKSMLSSSVSNIDKQYIDKILNKDIMNNVLSIQHAGIAVTGYSVDRVLDAVSDFEIHSITVQPTVGRQSTIRFRLPKLQSNGTFISNGTSYRLRKQRTELPIVKVNPTRVALTSYYSKLFVEKSERSVFNYDRWIANQIVAAALDTENTLVSDIKISKVSNNSVKLPRVYAALSERCASVTFEGETPMTLYFDHANRFKAGRLDKAIVERLEEKKGYVVAGKTKRGLVVIDFNDVFYHNVDGDLKVLGRIEDIANLSMEKAPTAMAELKIFSKVIPVGVALAYLMGLTELMKLLKVTPRRVPNGQRLNLMPDEYAVRFLDESLVFQKDDVKASLIFAGFNLYHGAIRNYSVYAFDKKDVYLNVLDANGIGIRFLRELDLMNAMWVDPITLSLLEQMGEPTEYTQLLIRSAELLMTRYVPTKLENANANFDGLERCRGYERFAGVVYSELVRSIRTYNTRTATSAASLSMNPHDVWTQITQDPAAELVDNINPIHNMKEKEVITFGGRGGRSQRSMVAEHRLYKKSDMGFISEATVDSGQVAIITYLPPNPNFTSVRGTVRSFDGDRDGSAALLSTAAMLSPGATRDD